MLRAMHPLVLLLLLLPLCPQLPMLTRHPLQLTMRRNLQRRSLLLPHHLNLRHLCSTRTPLRDPLHQRKHVRFTRLRFSFYASDFARASCNEVKFVSLLLPIECFARFFSQNTILFIFAYVCRSGSPKEQLISAKDVSIGLHENSAVEIREFFFLLLELEVLRLKAEGEIEEELARSVSC